jgi:hypothetical protein
MRTIVMAGVAAALMLAVAGPLSAQSVGECRKIAGAAERLACYDRLPAEAASDPSFRPQIAPQPPLARPAAPANPTIAAAETAVRRNVDNPDEARFIGVQQKGNAVCGYVNAKNSAGGYTGAKLFVFVPSTGETHVLDKPAELEEGAGALAAYQSHCKAGQ